MRRFAAIVATCLFTTGALATETITYQYDVHGRLGQVNHSGTVNNGLQKTYSFDPADNRTSLAVSGGWACGASTVALKNAKAIAPAGAASAETLPASTQTVFVKTGTSLTIPAEWCWPYSISAIGGGASGYPGVGASGSAGGGGGAFAAMSESDALIIPGQTIYFSVGSGGAGSSSGTGNNGGDTWVNFAANVPPEGPTEGILAKGGSAPSPATTGGIGGQAFDSIGSTVFNGGDGGILGPGAGGNASGGGGAGGPLTDGGSGAGAGGGGGGWGSGGSGGLLSAGGFGWAGTGYIQSSNNETAGAGGGGGGAGERTANAAGYPGGLAGVYGGGGGGGGGGMGVSPVGGPSGSGAPGIIILTYTRYGYDPAADAYFAAMNVQPDATRKLLINDLIVGLKADGLWDKIAWLSLLASHDEQSARLNAKNPSQIFTAVNTPTFTVDRGYAGNGVDSYLDAGVTFGSSGIFTQNSAFLSVWQNAAATSGQKIAVGNDVTHKSYLTNSTSTNVQAFINGNSSITGPFTTGGMVLVTRTSSTQLSLYRNGASVQTGSGSSSGVPTGNVRTLGVSTMYSDARQAMVAWGSSFSSTDATNFYNRLNIYLSAISAN